jgi:hypothetical protein
MDIENIEKSVKFSRWIVSSIFVVTLGSYVGWFFLFQGQPLSVESGVWGSFGDFVGGLLNPLIAYSAFYWLTVSVVVQKRELAETKQALIDSSRAQQEQVKVQTAHVDVQRKNLISQESLIVAQIAQVNEANRSSGIEVINMQLNNNSIRLESEYAYRNGVALNAMSGKTRAQTMDRGGKTVSSMSEILASNKRIGEIEVKQRELINAARNLLKDNLEDC